MGVVYKAEDTRFHDLLRRMNLEPWLPPPNGPLPYGTGYPGQLGRIVLAVL